MGPSAHANTGPATARSSLTLAHDEKAYKGAGTEDDPYVVDWLEGERENPYNWSRSRKWVLTYLVRVFLNIFPIHSPLISQTAFSVLCIAFSSSSYSGGIGHVMHDLHCSQEEAILGVSLYVLGFGLGPLLFGPLSEVCFIVHPPCAPFSDSFVFVPDVRKGASMYICPARDIVPDPPLHSDSSFSSRIRRTRSSTSAAYWRKMCQRLLSLASSPAHGVRHRLPILEVRLTHFSQRLSRLPTIGTRCNCRYVECTGKRRRHYSFCHGALHGSRYASCFLGTCFVAHSFISVVIGPIVGVGC